jgi:mycoredoxin
MADMTIYTTRRSADCDRAKRFLDEEGIFYDEVDIERSPEAALRVQGANGGRRVVPTFEVAGELFSLKPFDLKKLMRELEKRGIDE